jgi:hypothetical protein
MTGSGTSISILSAYNFIKLLSTLYYKNINELIDIFDVKCEEYQ